MEIKNQFKTIIIVVALVLTLTGRWQLLLFLVFLWFLYYMGVLTNKFGTEENEENKESANLSTQPKVGEQITNLLHTFNQKLNNINSKN